MESFILVSQSAQFSHYAALLYMSKCPKGRPDGAFYLKPLSKPIGFVRFPLDIMLYSRWFLTFLKQQELQVITQIIC